jgi:hypothetical protein
MNLNEGERLSKVRRTGFARLLLVLRYILISTVFILIVHYLIDIRFDISLGYFRFIAVGIALTVGYKLAWTAQQHFSASILTGLIIASFTAFGMSTSVWIVLGGGDIFPVGATEWQDLIEYLISIISATAAGNMLAGSIFRTFVPTEFHSAFIEIVKYATTIINGDVTGRLRFIERVLKALTAVLLAIGALYAGLRGLFR